MECIICQDAGTEPLKDNEECACKYKVHNSCWLDYVRHVNNVRCLLCRKEYTITIIQEPFRNAHQDIIIVINQPNLVQGRNISAPICAAGVSISLAILIVVLVWN